MSSWPFSVLEVSADATERDIKRAYARKLKSVHPEDDPTGFQALRQAYEAALSGQWSGPLQAYPGNSSVEPEVEPEPAANPPRNDGPTYVPQSRSHDEELWERQEALLQTLRDETASGQDRVAALDAILASPALENVGRMAEVEAWVGSLIGEHPGVTDALLDRAIGRFGWDRERRWDTAWFVDAALARRDSLVFVRQLHDPAHRLNAGYRLLQRPPGGFVSTFVNSSKVRPVLRLLDAEPGLQPEFQYELVERWRAALDRLPFNRPEGKGSVWRLIFLIFWVGFIVFKCVNPGSFEDAPVPLAPAPEVMTEREVDTCRRAAREDVLAPEAYAICNAAQIHDEFKIAALSDSGLIYLRMKDWGSARALYDSVLQLSPNDARALYGRGLALAAMDTGDKGRLDTARALKINPSVGKDYARYGFAEAPMPPFRPGRDGPLVTGKRGASYIAATWMTLPGQEQIDRRYPARALDLEKSGRVVLDCAVVAGGTLADCFVLTEEPADFGFADAAMGLSRFFRVDAPGVADGNGRPSRVKFAVRFQMAGEKT